MKGFVYYTETTCVIYVPIRYPKYHFGGKNYKIIFPHETQFYLICIHMEIAHQANRFSFFVVVVSHFK